MSFTKFSRECEYHKKWTMTDDNKTFTKCVCLKTHGGVCNTVNCKIYVPIMGESCKFVD